MADGPKYFVMLRGNNGTPIPLMAACEEWSEHIDCDDLALFDSKEDAEKAAKINPLGEAFGYEVFEWLM